MDRIFAQLAAPLTELERSRAGQAERLGVAGIFDMLGLPPMERDVQVGQLIAGKYRVEKLLGRGGMGVVMLALHEQLNQRVALKFLTDDAYQQPEAVTRFLREARSAVQIQSEHVARVMDVGTLESGAPYMVMEYLRGLDLKDVSTRRGPLPVSEGVDYLLQACVAVAEAHSLGIVHRDLKPSNLFLTERPDGSPLVKVLDFGISKALHGARSVGETSQQQMTATSAIMGSPQYMSPEQIRSSKNVDARADIWALGTILHELLSGSPAYIADTVPGLLAMIVADAPPPLTATRPDAPAELEAVILHCLEKDRERRFGSVAELARALERFASPEARTLVRRIGRVLGDHSGDRGPLSMGSGNMTTREASIQTHSTWARTGRVHDGGATPFYARPTVQLGAGVGILGVGLVAWLLLVRSADDISTAPPVPTSTLPTSTVPIQTPTTSAPPVKLGSTSGQHVLPPPTTGGVRPVRDDPPPVVVRSPDPAPSRDAPPPAEDDDPRAAHNFRDDATTYPSANSKKNDLAAAARKPRRGNTTKPTRAAPPEPPASVSPAAEPKKSNPLDLFNDTK